VSVVLAVVLAIARSVGIRRRGRVALSALALVAFVILARPSPSVLRATVMGGVGLLGLFVGRRINAVQAIGFAVLVLVLVNPFLARSVGFVLSVCATSAIVLVAPGWTDRLATRMPRPLATAIAVPAAAQLACTPVLVMVFGQLTPYAIVANVLAAPAVVPATIAGVGCATTAMVWLPAAEAVAWVAALPTWLIAQVVRLLAAFPAAGLRAPTGRLAGCLYLAAAAWLVSRCVRVRNRSAARDILGA
jgi:competence protein ComEC